MEGAIGWGPASSAILYFGWKIYYQGRWKEGQIDRGCDGWRE